jgi:hypothetical protein
MLRGKAKVKPTTISTILLTNGEEAESKRFSSLRPFQLDSSATIRESLAAVGKRTLWISGNSVMTDELLKSIPWPLNRRLGRAILLHKPTVESIATLSKLFERVAYGAYRGFLSGEELAEVLKASNRDVLFIGGTVDKGSETVTLWRGNLDSLIVPFSAFSVSGDGIEPDFNDFGVIDYGQVVRFGNYEATTDVILYKYDSEYRRRKNKERIASERGLGPAIRRLRIQRGLRQEDFPGIAAKTIARIEQGKVGSVHEKTRAAIASALGVDPKELDTF